MTLAMNSGGTANIHLSLAVCNYFHTRDLTDGLVKADGITLTPLVFPSIEEITYRFVRNLEWDVSELSFGKYIALASQADVPMIGLPIFPSRMHRLSSIYIRTDRSIRSPKDLEGRKVGIPEWAQTAGIYVRGMLGDHYGVDLGAIEWVQAGVDEPGRGEKVSFELPLGYKYAPRPETTLSAMLEAGEIDAVISARTPLAATRNTSMIGRLFSNFREEEERLFQQTGVYPIMHLMTVRRDLLDQYPWIAMNLFKAFEESKRRALALLADFTCSRAPLPWISEFAESALSRDANPYPYGIEASRPTLEAFCRYAHEQGVTGRLLTAEELFPETMIGGVKV